MPHQQAFLNSDAGQEVVRALWADEIQRPNNPHNLTEPEWVSLLAYTTGPAHLNGAALNAALRSGNPPPDMLDYRDTLEDALARLPAGPRWVVRRTTLPATELDLYQEGAEVDDAGFTSASELRSAGWHGPHLFWIESRAGKKISHYSVVGNGREVLFEAGTRFLVTSRVPLNGNRVNFELREI